MIAIAITGAGDDRLKDIGKYNSVHLSIGGEYD